MIAYYVCCELKNTPVHKTTTKRSEDGGNWTDDEVQELLQDPGGNEAPVYVDSEGWSSGVNSMHVTPVPPPLTRHPGSLCKCQKAAI